MKAGPRELELLEAAIEMADAVAVWLAAEDRRLGAELRWMAANAALRQPPQEPSS